MVSYWSRVPGTQAMPNIWVYELEKRVRAGQLSHEDAVGIFNTAMAGAEAQEFKPTGDTSAAVHKSSVDFLGKAETVYFAKKKKKTESPAASRPGAYRNSGGRVFPTEKNSGLTGEALRKQQEGFFERGISQGKTPEELRGQAQAAGLERIGRQDPPDRLEDADVEAALQRAIKRRDR
jgi:hypothetical protein